jgi:hypothetical protein
MKTSIRPATLAVPTLLLAGSLLCACSQSDPPASGSPSSEAATIAMLDAQPPAETPTMPIGDPCALLTDLEVRKAFPGAAAGKREHGLDVHGIRTCLWDTPTDRFVVQTFEAKSGSVEDELRSRMLGSVDPLMAGAADHVRYETIAGVGDQTMLVVEKADPQRGILADTAVLVTQRDGRRAVLFTGSSLAGGDRASALVALETLGRSAAERL